MTSALVTLAVVLAVSVLEGLWAWLLAAAVSEVTDQVHPSWIFLCTLLAIAWLTCRVLPLSRLTEERQRQILVTMGLIAALAAGTVHAGLLHPLDLVFGRSTPDYRGAGVVVVLLTAYLRGRGLALARGVNRERVIGHLAACTFALSAVLLFLPLVQVVKSAGLGVVVLSFLLGASALLLVQTSGAESRVWTRTQWAAVGFGVGILLLLGAAAIAGTLSSGLLLTLSGWLLVLGQGMSPVTNAVLMAAGYLAQALVVLLRWLRDVIGTDNPPVEQLMRSAEQTRLRIEDQPLERPPEVLVLLVAVTLTTIFAAVAIWVFYRLTARHLGQDLSGIEEVRSRVPGAGRSWRGLFGNRGDAEAEASDAHERIRQLYRSFQTLMARAGHPRTAAQTPNEYAQALSELLPSTDASIANITSAYVLVRYASPTVSAPDAAGVAHSIENVRNALRHEAD